MDQGTSWDDDGCNNSNAATDHHRACWPRSLSSGRKYDRFVAQPTYGLPLTRSGRAPAVWISLWRKIKREKKKRNNLNCKMAIQYSTRFSYDPFSYSQNFDQGSFWADSDDLSRSFSARFAVPARIFGKNEFEIV